MTWALHFANILILCSFLVRDILILRLLSIGAGIFFCMYFWHEDMIEPIIWNVLFSLVNIFQIGMLWFKRRKIPLLVEEQFLKDRFFPNLHATEIRDLYQCGHQQHLSEGTELEQSSCLSLIINGHVLILRETKGQLPLCTGQFIGVKGYLSQQPSTLKINTTSNVVFLQWNSETLKNWTNASAERHNLLLSALSQDLISKMDRNIS